VNASHLSADDSLKSAAAGADLYPTSHHGRGSAMIRWPISGAALAVLLFLQSALVAQVPGIGGVGGVGGVGGATSAVPGAAALPASPAAAPNNIWSKLCPTPDQMQACLQKLCACPLVQFTQ